MSKREKVWYEDPNLRNLYVKSASNAMKGYHLPITTPKTVFTGTNSLTDFTMHLGAYLNEDEKRVLIIVDKDLRKFGDRVAKFLKEKRDIDSRIFDEVLPEVPKSKINKAIDLCKEFDPKVFLAIGGGSAIDMSKLILLYYEKPEINVNQMMPPSYVGLRKKVHILAAIPTTSGTGAEGSFNAMILDDTREPHSKVAVALYEFCPDYVILHSDFVKTMPQWLTMGTGMDALAHAAGAYVLIGSSPFTDAMNIAGIEMILQYLPRAVKRGNDMEAREKMQMASYLAGIGFINTSAAGIEHAMGHSLGAVFHIHHGITVGIFLAPSIAYQAKVTDRFLKLAEIFAVELSEKPRHEVITELAHMSNEEALHSLLSNLRKFMDMVGAPKSISELEMPKIEKSEFESKLDHLSELAWIDNTSLYSSRPFTPENVKRVIKVAWDNKIEDLIDLYKK
ncbi:MAG: iron-containing alcohol dehydrogenase [Candidatus Lokiarchaeota archaeon]|nr:iron-containing alcohol dehydrogenase [Candidatus Lokiarchaeota archaeon]MBD3200787.1 iron-containing alcohol dehydrogenase [Candidatus Lokiarchaeota archaeon]